MLTKDEILNLPPGTTLEVTSEISKRSDYDGLLEENMRVILNKVTLESEDKKNEDPGYLSFIFDFNPFKDYNEPFEIGVFNQSIDESRYPKPTLRESVFSPYKEGELISEFFTLFEGDLPFRLVEKQTVELYASFTEDFEKSKELGVKLTYTKWLENKVLNIGTKYLHFKGNVYFVIEDNVLETESQKLMTVYKNESGKVFVQDSQRFHGYTDNAKTIKRFEQITS